MCIGASEGASGCAALRRAAPPHGPSAWLASGPRHIRAERYVPLCQLDLGEKHRLLLTVKLREFLRKRINLLPMRKEYNGKVGYAILFRFQYYR